MPIRIIRTIKYNMVTIEKDICITFIKEKIHITSVATAPKYGIVIAQNISNMLNQIGKSQRTAGKPIKNIFIISRFIFSFVINKPSSF